MEDPKLLGAYLLFYWPISYAQARFALGEMPERPRQVLDLGSGPGPLAFAALDAGAGEVTAADRSQAALDLVRKLAAEAGEAIATRSWKATNESLPEGTYDLVMMGHVINELWAGQPDAIPRRAGVIERAFSRLRPHGAALVIEPALRETSRGLLEVRNRLLEKGFAVRSPCLFRGACPALERETDWCHSERPWDPPRMIADIARAAGLHKEALKMTYMTFTRQPSEPQPVSEERLFRIVSEPLHSKGRQRYMGCGPEGRVGLSLQEKHINEGNQIFSRLARGEVIAIEGTEQRGDGLALGADSHVEVRARAGQRLELKR
jgi:SAM-dependent methyltransferase